jgi:NACHT domain
MRAYRRTAATHHGIASVPSASVWTGRSGLTVCAMRRGGWYSVAVLGSALVGAGIVWLAWPRTSAGQFDPVGAVLALAGLAVGVVGLRFASQSQRQGDTDAVSMAGRLAATVLDAESRARWQLLGGDDRTIDVRFTFGRAYSHNAAGAVSRGTLAEVVEYYQALLPRRLVITGEGGSGKTVLAIQLILRLLKDRAPNEPVPVRLSASLLDTRQPVETAVAHWLVAHLRRAFRLSRTAAEQLVAARMVLPVIDGLDEMDTAEEPGYESRAAQAIRACNAYLEGDQKGRIVLTCRTGQYEALESAREWVHDAARVRLSPVSVAAARTFLTGRVMDKNRWQPVLRAIGPGGNRALRAALSTPWRLAMAATVYEQRDASSGEFLREPTELVSPELDSGEKIRDHLLGLFIPASVAARGGLYPAERVHRWLATLARYLEKNGASGDRPARILHDRELSGTDLVVQDLWPLIGPRRVRAVSLLPVSSAGIWLAYLVLTHVISPFSWHAISSDPWALLRFPMVLTAIVLLEVIKLTWSEVWTSPATFRAVWTRTVSGRRWLVAVGILAGLIFSAVGGFVNMWGTPRFDIPQNLPQSVKLRLAQLGYVNMTRWHEFWSGTLDAFLIFPLYILMLLPDEEYFEYERAGPVDALRSSIIPDLAGGILAALYTYVVIRSFGNNNIGLAGGANFQIAVASGLVCSTGLGVDSWRYAMLLICTRRWSGRWLPWRLARFLRWSYDAGLLRIAASGYQFRHRELQEYLVRHPTA